MRIAIPQLILTIHSLLKNKILLKRKIRAKVDKFKGLDFLSVIETRELDYSAYVHISTPSPSEDIRAIFRKLKITKKDSIIDIGCGKGNAIRNILKYPFYKIHGIELIPEISNIATQNFDKMKTNRVKIFNVDSLNFDKYSDYNYFYLFSPFPCKIFNEVLHAILEQTKNKVEIYLIFCNFICYNIPNIKPFEIIHKFKSINGHDIVIFKRSLLNN